MRDVNGPMDVSRTQALLDALELCDGASATVVAVTESHAMLVLRMTPARGDTVTLLCGECRRIETCLRWPIVRLEYDVSSTTPYRYRLFDTAAGFSVECGVIFVAHHPDEWKAVDSIA